MPKRLIFLGMIKNESRIIKRCVQSVLNTVDAVCICDTGSTDNTVEVLTDFFGTLDKPAKVFTEGHEWKNFGHNRSQSFLQCRTYCEELGWDVNDTYALVMDADMELRIGPNFSKELLKEPGYRIIQQSGNLEYYNVRFLQVGFPWKCTGVTHEYWDGHHAAQFDKDVAYIADIGDGGCKADKFERDVRLLEQGLKDEPNNPRYLFYLAQSYKDSGQKDKAIEYYKKRIDAGAWYEEVWYSMYTIMKLYADKNMPAEVEYWGLKAYEYRKERAENILYLVRYFKDRRQYWKAWHYWTIGSQIKKPNDMLFLETDCYTTAFEAERSIIHDYVFPEKKDQSLRYSLEYFNKSGQQFAYSNIMWFVQPVKTSLVRNLQFQDIGDFVPTSTSMVRLPSGMIRLNVRYVNYRIQPNGSYLMSEGGTLSGNNPVRTENYTCLMDKEYNLVSALEKMIMPDPPTFPGRIKGLEDVRLFLAQDGKLSYVATTGEYSYDGKIRQHTGIYDVNTHKFVDNRSLAPPSYTECEKNWIPYKGNKFIYRWHPFEIGVIDTDNQLFSISKQDTPNFLSHMRGSSTLVQDGDFFYGITHCVIYNTPRKYYHMVVKIDARTDRLVGYTQPFYFMNNAIEYCLGFDKRGDTFLAIVSQNDRNPIMIEFKDADVQWNTL